MSEAYQTQIDIDAEPELVFDYFIRPELLVQKPRNTRLVGRISSAACRWWRRVATRDPILGRTSSRSVAGLGGDERDSFLEQSKPASPVWFRDR